MTKTLITLPLALLVSGAVHAATEHPWYAGARVGGTNYDHFDKALDGQESRFERDDWGGGVFLGFQQNSWFSVEGGYTYLGQADFKNGSGGVEVQGVDFVGKFSWAASPVVDLYGKLGGFIFDVDNSVNNSDDKGVAATAGVGAEYYFNESLSTRLEYQYYHQVGDKAPGETDIHFYGVSLVYHWGAVAPISVMESEPMPMPEPMPAPEMVKVPAFSVNLPFDFDSSLLTQKDFDLMKPIAQRLTADPNAKLYVVGHTDARGSDAYNVKLAEERAAAVAAYLKDHFGLTQDRIVVQGKGEREPIAPNNTDAGRAKNRRVEVYSAGFEMKK